MRLISATLENYRQYKGKQTVQFSDAANKNITIIEGVNGAGKTNFLNAITWCLYGKEDRFRTAEEKEQGIVNEQAVDELKQTQIATARVVIDAVDSDKRRLRFERYIEVQKTKDGQTYHREPVFKVYKEIGHDMTEVGTPAWLINRMLPEGIRNFFFFDGEKLDAFFKEEDAGKVKQAISDVSQLSLLDLTIDHLGRTLSDIRASVKGESPQVDEISQEIQTLEGSKELLKGRLAEQEKIYADTRSKLSDAQEKLRNTDVALVNGYQKQRDELNQQIETNDAELTELNDQLNEFLLRSLPIVYSQDALKKSLGIVNEKKQKGYLPPKIQAVFVKELLDQGECICGSNLKNDKEKNEKVLRYLAKKDLSEISEYLNEGTFEINQMLGETKKMRLKLDELGRRIETKEKIVSGLRDKVAEIDVLIKGIDAVEISNLETARAALDKDSRDAYREIGIINIQINSADQRMITANKNLERELAKSAHHQAITEQLRIGDEILEVYNTARSNLVGKIRAMMAEKTKEHFLALIWKKNTYTDVIIDENYNVSVINKLKLECLGTLSAGERQVLALSFMAALREVSGFDAPVLIDTPLGRISGEPKKNIAKLLPEYLKNAQVTLLVTDEEYTPEVKRILSDVVGKAYKLEYKENESKTYVKPYGE